MRYQTLLLLPMLILAAGCDVHVADEPIAAPVPDFVTATLPPTSIAQPTRTPIPPSPVPTVPPIAGTTTTQVNVRAETSTASESLGMIAQFTSVQISGQDASGTWYRIVYAESPSGGGWVRSEYVQVDAAVEIPVILPAAGNGGGVSGLVIQRINIRSGAGTGYESLGFLSPNDVVLVIGRNASGSWFQIEFADSPDGKGWASSEFLRVDDVNALPLVEEGTEAEEAIIEMATEVLPPALQDGDSAQTPLTRVVFAPGAIRALQVESSLSSPNGDLEDWVEFSSPGTDIIIQLSCSDGVLQVELWDTTNLQDSFLLSCGDERFVRAPAGSNHFLKLTLPTSNDFYIMRYVLKIKANS